MNRGHVVGWFALSLLLSALMLLIVGPQGDMAVHWQAGGTANLILPAWSVAVAFPALLALLLVIITRTGRARMIGRSRDRTATLVAIGLLAAQAFVLRHAVGAGRDPLAFSIFLAGALLAVAGNFWAKDHGTSTTGARRRTALILFVLGLLSVAAAMVVSIVR